MSEIPEDQKELYFMFGRTAEMAQVLELEAGNLALAYVSVAFDPETITDEERRYFQAIIDDVNRRTFGNLLRQIRKTCEISERIEKTINDALEKRNYLVHRFFRTHNFAINSKEGRAEMRTELEQIYETFSLAHATLSGMTHTFNEIFGRPNISDEEALRMMNKGKRFKI